MKVLNEYLSDFFSLVYPRCCASCGEPLNKGEEVICIICQYELPKTHFHLEPDNMIERHFWGRIKIERAASCFYFQKGSKVQHLIHQLKYRGKTEAGLKIGEIYGHDLIQSVNYTGVDLIVPVPLHHSKELQRGYNQVHSFCEGLSKSMMKPWAGRMLERKSATATQTRKSRFERWMNVETIFNTPHPSELEGKHVLLADDVITTGSTLEACARAVLRVPGTKVSIATIACAMI